MRILRTDIQILRAIAVLSVLVFHFDLPGLQKGFLGVDIFFVISGYLMSRVIIDEMDAGRFSPASFYFRRARRLLPAALAMFAVVTAVVPFALTMGALHDYVAQLLGALAFGANMVLWAQSGYFDGEATLKPLLHTWSLALEEQYYFVLPLVLVLIGRRWRAVGLVGLLLSSLLACQWWLTRDPSGAFYLLPFRAWELLLGSVCALPGLASRLKSAHAPSPTKRFDSGWLWLPIMAWSLLHGVDSTHPRTDALLVCLSTAGLILQPSAMLQSTRPWMRPLHWIGDISYSLYLVHWPLIALAKNIWLQEVPGPALWGLLALAFVLAQLSYRYVEQRFRNLPTPGALFRQMAWLLIPLLVAGGALALHMHRHERASQAAQNHQPVYGFDASCDQEGQFKALPACMNAPAPHTMVWGDSYAMHLIPALLASPPEGGVIQATRSACGPSLDMARQSPKDPPDRGQHCIAFNRSVLAYLRQHPEIDVVALSGRWQYFVDDPVVDAQGHFIHPDAHAVAVSFAQVVKQLKAMGKRVVLVSPPALLGPDVDLGLCGQRAAQGLLTMTKALHTDCAFDRSELDARQARVHGMLAEARQLADIDMIDLDAFNCDDHRCVTVVNQVPLYRDFGHFSLEGARLLGQDMQLGRKLRDNAH
ncbi:MAG: acyltransferase [Aquabacterium sp.]|nr:acyltransferase [Aquabacterium sp.]